MTALHLITPAADAGSDDADPGLPPPEVIDAFLKDCRCCDCSDRPCAGAMAGGLCDRMCLCGADDDARGDYDAACEREDEL